MKVSKALLGAIVLGIAVQATTSSCTKKDKDAIKPAQEQPSDVVPDRNNPPYDCPACGMG